jgi:hypothetical protein
MPLCINYDLVFWDWSWRPCDRQVHSEDNTVEAKDTGLRAETYQHQAESTAIMQQEFLTLNVNTIINISIHNGNCYDLTMSNI